MIFRRFLITIAALTLAAGGSLAAPKPPPADEALLKAYDAFRAGDAVRLQKSAALVGCDAWPVGKWKKL